ncbi:hypothetical protein GCM10010116_28850 [Microbispora rosea subsp. aerata]|nr:hypothetical protein GCM10010116_28850 [Microbispora rosea subsp. aerata]GLJ87196.1 hypothetical protein GCM10017588_59400 [Microbispora rosea subsp. aerata]
MLAPVSNGKCAENCPGRRCRGDCEVATTPIGLPLRRGLSGSPQSWGVRADRVERIAVALGRLSGASCGVDRVERIAVASGEAERIAVEPIALSGLPLRWGG